MGFINSGADESNVSVVHCGVDTDSFKPASPEDRAALRQQFGWEGRFVCLNISAMTPNKGVDLAMQAVAALIELHPELQLVLKGSDALYTSAQLAQSNLASLPQDSALKLESRIQYTGSTLSQQSMISLYQAADVYLSPYRAEGFNLPVLEAAACGLPVICTDGGPTDEFVSNDFALRVKARIVSFDTGLKRLEPELDDLVRQLGRMITDATVRERARLAGPEWVRSRFTWRHSVDKLMTVMLD
jgi:glycosyltransferase involved in cell wall biosynthesis